MPRRKPPQQPSAIDAVRTRLNGHAKSWDGLLAIGRDERLGSQLGILELRGALSESQAEAARVFARFCASADHAAGIRKRNISSPGFERGTMGRSDDEALAALQGNLVSWERKQRSAWNRWTSLHDRIEPATFGLLLRVAVENQPCPAGRLSELRNALAGIARELRLDGAPARSKRRGGIRAWRAPDV